MNKNVISWFSGGIASAVTCMLVIDKYGVDNVKVIFIDTHNEHEDTARFLEDCQEWYGLEIEKIESKNFKTIEEVWFKYKSLNVAHGAICSTVLKRQVREDWQKENKFTSQAFGFDTSEEKRAKGMQLNYPSIKPFFPLIETGISKQQATKILINAGIEPPEMYKIGFQNNNCFSTGCVQGGIGYWQMIKELYPEKFEKMAKIEHELTELKGQPVTVLKDQSGGVRRRLFLLPHPNYPDLPHIGQKKGRRPKPLLECNGFCGVNDFENPDLFENYR